MYYFVIDMSSNYWICNLDFFTLNDFIILYKFILLFLYIKTYLSLYKLKKYIIRLLKLIIIIYYNKNHELL